jgi:flagellar basal-body rod modification protein FlgD
MAGADSKGAVKQNELGKDDFLRLLIAQLQSQDPLNPLQSAEFTSQLAQFSSLEQLNNVNDRLVQLHEDQIDSMKGLAVSMIGRSVKVPGTQFSLMEGKSDELVLELTNPAKTVRLDVYDDDGTIVDTVDLGPLNAGEHRLNWDGIGRDEKRLPNGRYSFQITALDLGAEEMKDVQTFIFGDVSGVSFNDDVPSVLMGYQSIALSKILQISNVNVSI